MDPVSLGIMGGSALFGGIMSLFGANKQASAAERAAKMQADAAREAGRLTQDSANEGAAAITQAIPTANAYVSGAAGDANNRLAEYYNQVRADTDPYRQAGAAALGKSEALADEQFSFSQDDPSYQFRMAEGMKALERSAAARGGATGGAALKAITRYGQDYASTEYGKAFERFNTGRVTRGNLLNNLIGAGQTGVQQASQAGGVSATGQSGNIMDAGKFAGSNSMSGTTTAAELRLRGAEGYGNALTSAANANAAGDVTIFSDLRAGADG